MKRINGFLAAAALIAATAAAVLLPGAIAAKEEKEMLGSAQAWDHIRRTPMTVTASMIAGIYADGDAEWIGGLPLEDRSEAEMRDEARGLIENVLPDVGIAERINAELKNAEMSCSRKGSLLIVDGRAAAVCLVWADFSAESFYCSALYEERTGIILGFACNYRNPSEIEESVEHGKEEIAKAADGYYSSLGLKRSEYDIYVSSDEGEMGTIAFGVIERGGSDVIGRGDPDEMFDE